MNPTKLIRSAAISAALLSLAACGGGGASSNTGQLKIGLTDGPVESAERVVVAFTGIELKPAGGPPMEPIVFDANSCADFDAATGTCSIDLLTLTGDERKIVFNETLEAGSYNWIRLLVNAELNEMDSYIEFGDGSMCSLYVPSSAQSGLKIVSGITVTANGVSDYTLDFDVRKSITQPPGLVGPMGSPEMCAANYLMKPAIRIVDTTEVGTISGTVSETLLENSGCTTDDTTMRYENVAAYVFQYVEGAPTPDDIDDDDTYPDPITTASIVFDDDPAVNAYVYEAGFLLSSEDYLVALTCTSNLDFPDTDEFDPDSEDVQDFGFIAEQAVDTFVDGAADGSFE